MYSHNAVFYLFTFSPSSVTVVEKVSGAANWLYRKSIASVGRKGKERKGNGRKEKERRKEGKSKSRKEK